MGTGLSGKTFAIVLAGTLLGMTLQLTQGQYSPFGVAVMAIALLVGLTGMWLKASLSEGVSQRFLLLLIVLQLFTTLFAPADDSLFSRSGINFTIHLLAFVLITLSALAITNAKPLIARAGFISTLLIFAVLGIWSIHRAPKPFIDVHPMHTEASEALLRLENPYAITVKNMYGPTASQLYYPPGSVIDGRVQFGFPYMPLALIYSTPFYAAWGDPRYAYLFAMIVAAGLITIARPDALGMLLGVLCLYTPASLYILQMCWIEPLCAMLLAATAVCAIRFPRGLPIALGLLLVSKQYLPAAIALIPLLDRRDKWSIAWKSIFAAAIVSLPLAVWDPAAFINSAIKYHLTNPFRRDSLSFVAWWASSRPDWNVPFWLSFIALAGTIAWCLWRLPRGIHSFATAFAFCFFVFVALSKQAFMNYHYLIVVAAFLAAAAENCISSAGSSDNRLSDHAPPTHPHLSASDDACGVRPARAA